MALMCCLAVGEPALFTWLYGTLRTGLRLRLINEGHVEKWWMAVTIYACVCFFIVFVTVFPVLPRYLKSQPTRFHVFLDSFMAFFLVYLVILLKDDAASRQLGLIGLQWLWIAPLIIFVIWAVFIRWRWDYISRISQQR